MLAWLAAAVYGSVKSKMRDGTEGDGAYLFEVRTMCALSKPQGFSKWNLADFSFEPAM